MGPKSQPTPHISETEAGQCFDLRELTDGEITGDEVTIVVFPIPTRIYGCPWLAQRLAEASSTVAMADGDATQRWSSHLRHDELR